MNSLAVSQLGLAFVIALGASSTLCAEDLARLQGSWEMTASNNGVQQRVVKTVDGQTETVEVYSNGVLTQKHHVDFELEKFGPAKVFIWRNGRITAGPRAGQPLPDGRFIYRIENDIWICVHGMLDGDKTGVLREVYKRIGDPPAGPAT